MLSREELQRSEPRSEQDLHLFEPVSDDDAATVRVRAACSCGWEGASYPVDDPGYEEALDEHQMHVTGQLSEPEELN